jgi:hypothetical protein
MDSQHQKQMDAQEQSHQHLALTLDPAQVQETPLLQQLHTTVKLQSTQEVATGTKSQQTALMVIFVVIFLRHLVLFQHQAVSTLDQAQAQVTAELVVSPMAHQLQ